MTLQRSEEKVAELDLPPSTLQQLPGADQEPRAVVLIKLERPVMVRITGRKISEDGLETRQDFLSRFKYAQARSSSRFCRMLDKLSSQA